MDWKAILLLLAAFSAVCRAQEEDGEGSVIEFGEGPGNPDADYKGVQVEPFPPPVPPEQEEPNRPPPVVVGKWEPPKLKEADRAVLDDLLARRAEQPGDVDRKYRLAEFYLRVGWLPQSEAEFLACAALDPDSIRPWEGLLRVYAANLPEREFELPEGLVLPAGLPAAQARAIRRQFGRRIERTDWIPSRQERSARVARALAEIVNRRPDDVARRRALLAHHRGEGRYGKVAEQARAILERVPGDADTRFELVSSILFRSQEGEALDEARALLEENLERAPDHARSLLRLARILAVQDGAEARGRIEELQQRAFLNLFVVSELGTVPFREDVFRMAKNLSGKVIADGLWDRAMRPPSYDPWRDGDETRHYVRWLEPFKFPHSEAAERERVVRTLGRRGDAAAAVVLLSFLWHAEDPESYPADWAPQRKSLESLVGATLESVGGLGGIAFPPAEKFLRMAEEPAQRRRGVEALRLIGDKRAAGVLIDALAWDNAADRSYGVAAALESLGEPRAIDALVAAATETERPVVRRREAAEALAAFNDPRSIEAIRRLGKSGEFAITAAYGRFRLTGDAAALEELVQAAESDVSTEELLRLAAKCDDPRIKDVYLAIIRKSRDPAVREKTLRGLKARFWKESREEVEAIFLKEAESLTVSAFVLHELGEIGGEAATTRLLEILESGRVAGELHWAAACRALARTGDARAVRWFGRRKVLEKDPGKRKLAEQLYEQAAKRHAELLRQQ